MAGVAELTRLTQRVDAVEAEAGGRDFSKDEARSWTERGPVAFGTERLGSIYWSRQIDILNAAWRDPRVAVRSANAMGKNFATADFMTWWIFAKGGAVIYMAPTDRQLDIGMRELRRALRNSGLPYEALHRSLRVAGETRLLAMTSNSADSLRGFHDPKGLLVVIDEGQGQSVEAVAYDAAFSCATGEGDKILVLGNPAHTGGRFQAISKADNWCPLRIAAHEHPNIREQRVVVSGGPAPDWPEQIAAEYGRESPFYIAFVEGEFPTEGSIDSLLRLEWILSAFDRHDKREAPTIPVAPVFALDVARYGSDACVLADVRGPVVESLTIWRNASITESAKRLLQTAEFFRCRRLVPKIIVDDVGLGAGVTDIVREAGWQVTAFNGAGRAPDPEHHLNLRAASHWKFRELLEKNVIALPRDQELEAELLALEWQISPSGLVQIVGKDAMRKTLGHSPDRGDSCVLGIWESIGGPPPPVWGTTKWNLYAPIPVRDRQLQRRLY